MRRLSFFRPWGRFYYRWAFAQSIATLFVAALFLFGADRAVTAAILLFFYAVSLSLLVLSGRYPLRLCNAVTATRWTLGLVGLGWLFLLEVGSMPLTIPSRWGLLAVFGIAETTDAVDGYLARRRGTTSYGAKLDMETDSAFGFILAFVAVAYFSMPAWVLALGLFHYVYFILFRFTEEPRRNAPAYRGFAKSVCAWLIIGLIVAMAPSIRYEVKTAINGVSLGLLILSFGWDLYLRVLPFQTARS